VQQLSRLAIALSNIAMAVIAAVRIDVMKALVRVFTGAIQTERRRRTVLLLRDQLMRV
jgi:hypothetical protein